MGIDDTEITREALRLQVEWICVGMFISAASVFITLTMFLKATYGRYHDGSIFGTIPGQISWLIMESPNIFVPLVIFYTYEKMVYLSTANLSLLAMFIIHYIQR